MITNTLHNEYCRRYKRVRDVVNGQYKLRQVDLARLENNPEQKQYNQDSLYNSDGYLRLINQDDKSAYNLSRNKNMIMGAILFNATARTLSGLMGLLFRNDPVWPELSDQMSYLIEDVDGSGLSLNHQSQSVAWNLLQTGRHGLLSDIPRNETGEPITLDRVRNGYRANIKQYSAENIEDYNETVINGIKTLDFLMLREYKTVWNDDGVHRTKELFYRVYRLEDDRVTVQIYNKGKTPESEKIEIRAGGQKKLKKIPFVFVGSINNSPDYDPLPIEPLVDTNLGHYQESANLRLSAWDTTAAQPFIADDNYFRWKSQNEDKDVAIDMGSSVVHIMGTGGVYGFAQPTPNTLSSDLMERDEARMVALGAQLINSGGQAETAEAARIKRGSDISILESIAVNVSDAYKESLSFCHDLMGENYEDLNCNINRDFFDTKMSAQEITAIVSAWQSGAISEMEKSRALKAGKIIGKKTDLEAMHEDIRNESMTDFGFNEQS